MLTVMRYSLGLFLWALAAYGSLRIADIPGEYTEALCGVWG